ncbi:recombinase RecA [symbiont of Argiope bruennichi]|uniref:recombinase RecA n=1 Tax=symbiont of Argiope bruennichi TaxID=2810479 RepID=UPI003DA39CC8
MNNETKKSSENTNLHDPKKFELLKTVITSKIKSNIFVDWNKKDFSYECINSGSLMLNNALGTNGYPLGRITEIYGPEASGKTTLALHAVSECQKAGKTAVYVDAEHAFDPNYAKSLGIDLDKLLLCQPDSGEQAFAAIELIIRSSIVHLLVIDSVAALLPTSELEGDIEDNFMACHARLMSKALRRINGIINKYKISVIFINQIREKVGITFGSNETTTGGRALKYFSSIRIDVRKESFLKNENSEIVGVKTKVKIVKNKVSAPFKSCSINIFYGKGIDKIDEVITFSIEKNIIEGKKSWFYFNNELVCQGKETLKEKIINDKNFYNELLKKIKINLTS